MYRSQRWQVVRRQILERDGWRCRRCDKSGILEVDHIRPIKSCGDWYDPENLQTLCRNCHLKKSAAESRTTVISPARKLLMEMAHGQS